jgi:amino acid permease
MTPILNETPRVAALWLAALVQIAIASANFVLPRKLEYRKNLARVSPIIRQVFLVHSGYIVAILIFFAALTFGFASDLSSGRGLGRFLAAFIALFWSCRIPLQLFYYDPTVRRANRLGDVAITVALVFVAGAYACAALV